MINQIETYLNSLSEDTSTIVISSYYIKSFPDSKIYKSCIFVILMN